MKATMSGVTVEGTPEEIAKVICLYELERVIDLTGDAEKEIVPGIPNAATAKILRTGGPRVTKTKTKDAKNGKHDPFDYDSNGVDRLMAFLRDKGGKAFPNEVSKRFGLSPFQRRKLVSAAKKAKMVKIGGNKRSTWYEAR